MRASAILYIGVLISVLTIGIISVLTMKSSYAETIRASLDDSIVYAVSQLQIDREGLVYIDADGNVNTVDSHAIDWETDIGDDEVSVFKKNFVENLVAHIDNRVTELQVNIYGVDINVGALSVEVIAKYNYPMGQEDTVSSYKTIILDKVEK